MTTDAPAPLEEAGAKGAGLPANQAVSSVSAFFPCYNDAPTIATMVRDVHATLRRLVRDFEVIVVNDGSTDDSAAVLQQLARELPEVRIVDHGTNRGYGAALISGFAASTKDWVFYTDGDAQYDATEVEPLIRAVQPGVDVVQGVKIGRGDGIARRVVGRLYHHTVKLLFGLRVRDTDCDFRLIRRAAMSGITLRSTSGVICVELMRTLQDAGARFIEMPVHHYARPHGRSQFLRIPHLVRAARGLASLWLRLIPPRALSTWRSRRQRRSAGARTGRRRPSR